MTDATAVPLSVTNVRRALHMLRQRWSAHSPAEPFCMCEEIEPGITFASLCVFLLISKRTRHSSPRAGKKRAVTEATPAAAPDEVSEEESEATKAPTTRAHSGNRVSLE